MKKLYTLISLLAISLAAFSQVVVSETFNYTVPGNIGGNTTTTTDLVGSNNWLTHSNTSAVNGVGLPGTIDVLTGNLSYSGLATSTGNKVLLPGNNVTVSRDVNRPITSTATTLYYSMLINVLDNTQLSPTVTAYFAGLGASTTTFGARLGIVSSNSAANYRLSIQNTSGGTPTFTENPVDLAFGTTNLVIVKYDLSTTPTTATLWVNPTSLGGVAPISTITNNSGTTAFTTFVNVFLRNTASTPKVEIDELRVGNTWADVTPINLSTTQNQIAGLNINPNPVSKGIFYVNTSANENKNVVIVDLLGKQALNTTISGNEINVSNLNAGVYIVKVTEQGKTATRKLVIQ